MDLKEFLIKNKNKDIVAVQGLGFVGAVMSLVVSNALEKDYAVIGVDLKENDEIINSINNGIFPIKSSFISPNTPRHSIIIAAVKYPF